MAILFAKSESYKGQLSHFVDAICNEFHQHEERDTKQQSCFGKTSVYKGEKNGVDFTPEISKEREALKLTKIRVIHNLYLRKTNNNKVCKRLSPAKRVFRVFGS